MSGVEITGDVDSTIGGGDVVLGPQEIAAALDSIGYIARDEPDYEPR